MRPSAVCNFLAALTCLLAACSRSPAPGNGPSPSLTPQQVVQRQLQALKDNDSHDAGIAVCFSFASPQNQAATGPLTRFTQIVRDPRYVIMLNHAASEFGPGMQDRDVAEQVVKVIDPSGAFAVFVFRLSRQTESPYVDCWMTDGVFRLPDPQEMSPAPVPGDPDIHPPPFAPEMPDELTPDSPDMPRPAAPRKPPENVI